VKNLVDNIDTSNLLEFNLEFNESNQFQNDIHGADVENIMPIHFS
jgi:hypothetical protein